eukprot:12686728-Alexandrium_andersonii.AAC.1
MKDKKIGQMPLLSLLIGMISPTACTSTISSGASPAQSRANSIPASCKPSGAYRNTAQCSKRLPNGPGALHTGQICEVPLHPWCPDCTWRLRTRRRGGVEGLNVPHTVCGTDRGCHWPEGADGPTLLPDFSQNSHQRCRCPLLLLRCE